MIETLEHYLVAKRQHTELTAALNSALAEQTRDAFAEAHIAHLRSDIATLLEQLQAYARATKSPPAEPKGKDGKRSPGSGKPAARSA